MKMIRLFHTLLWVSSALATIPLSSVKRATTLNIVENKFIIEVDSAADIPQVRRGLGTHEALYEELQKRAIGFHVNKEFDSAGIFIGASVTLANAQDAQAVTAIPGVRAIRPVRKIDRPQPVASHVVTGTSDPALPPDTESTHVLTGVDKLHAQNITGKGIKIGIIDTGIDYTHPALGSGFGPGHKVIGGFDLVGDDYDGTNTPVPDSDPLDQCVGHGTHVAGIIGADPLKNPFNISGVAFDSSLSAYRVFGCTGFVTDDVLVDALLLGVKEGQNILTLSLGGADGWTESSASVVASRIAALGTVVTIAAGNDGASGAWYSSSPGNGINVISVASLDNTVTPLQSATVGGATHDPIVYFNLFPFNVTGALPIFATSNDTTVVDDTCNPLGPAIPDLSKFVTIIRRGTCTFVQKMTNVAAKGGNFALIYDNGSGFNAISVGDFNASLIQAADGEFLVQQFAAGVPITLTFPQSGALVQFPNPAGGLISTFTSYGPTNDFFFKPAVAAPGGNILSTLPVNLGVYGIESGTSMATPFVAGSAALLFEAKGISKQVGTSARSLFESTANTIPSSHTDGDPLQTVIQQGAGLINVFDAIHTTTILSPTEIILNDTAHFQGVHSLTVTNTGKTFKKYTISHVPAGTAVTVSPDFVGEPSFFPALGPVPLTTDQANVVFSESTFTVPAGGRHTITVRFTLPQTIAESTLPVFSGFINIVSGTERVHASYIGLAASLIDQQTLDDSDFVFGVTIPAVLDSVGNVQEEPTNYTFVGEDFPTVLWRQSFGTPSFRLDLVDVNTTLPATRSRRAVGDSPFLTFPKKPSGSFAQVKIVGPITAIPFLTRSNLDDNLDNVVNLDTPTFANGTIIPNGLYRLLIRSLRVTGNPDREEDYEAWLSPIIGVNV